jgi:ribulose 1,5-bisphosphate synthetase/thiazole synthase
VTSDSGTDQKMLREPARDIPVRWEPDVLVAGAGVSGAAAAVSAARAGASVLLVERNGAPGGVAISGLMANITNFIFTQNGRQVIGGFCEEFIERMRSRGGVVDAWRTRDLPGICFDPEIGRLVLTQMIREAGVQVLLHAYVAGALVEDGAVRGAILESKSGREAARAKVTVDCTGDADVAARAGAPVREAADTGSMEFRLGGVDIEGFVEHFRRHPEEYPHTQDFALDAATFVRNWEQRGELFFPHGGGTWPGLFQRAVQAAGYATSRDGWKGLDHFGMYAIRGSGTVVINSNFFSTPQVDVEWLSRAELEAREMCFEAARFLRERIPGFAGSFVIETAGDWGVRATRWIEGEATLTRREIEEGARFADAIGCAASAKMVSGPHSGTGAWLPMDYSHDVPLGCMIPRHTEGLLVASGKSVSTDPRATLRSQSHCMVFGQGAGVAAAIAAQSGTGLREVDIRRVQQALLSQNVFLGDDSRLRQLGLA